MKNTILKIVLWWQGLYYALTGLWALVSLDNFSCVTGHFGDPFEMHSIAALAVVVGCAFLWGALYEPQRRFAGAIALGSAIAVAVPELIYFSEIQRTLFLPDLFEELMVGGILSAVFLSEYVRRLRGIIRL